MALFWFICGMLLICCIARYNESNKLFWTLLVSFIGAFTAASIVIAISSDNNDKSVIANVSPTQLYISTSSADALLTDVSYDTTYDVLNCPSVTVSQDYYVSKDILSCSGVSNLEDKPPQDKQLCYSILTHLNLHKQHSIKDSS